jgi:hypothetical protein
MDNLQLFAIHYISETERNTLIRYGYLTTAAESKEAIIPIHILHMKRTMKTTSVTATTTITTTTTSTTAITTASTTATTATPSANSIIDSQHDNENEKEYSDTTPLINKKKSRSSYGAIVSKTISKTRKINQEDIYSSLIQNSTKIGSDNNHTTTHTNNNSLTIVTKEVSVSNNTTNVNSK